MAVANIAWSVQASTGSDWTSGSASAQNSVSPALSSTAIGGRNSASQASGVSSGGADSNNLAHQAAADESESASKYASPVAGFDSTTGAAILKFRDGSSGESLYQVPSQNSLEYIRQQQMSLVESALKTSSEKTSVVA